MNAFSVTNWKEIKSAVVKGSFTVTLPSGMVIKNCVLCEKGEARWVNGPSRQFDAGGVKKFEPHIEFVDRPTRDRFNHSVLEALDEHLGVGR